MKPETSIGKRPIVVRFSIFSALDIASLVGLSLQFGGHMNPLLIFKLLLLSTIASAIVVFGGEWVFNRIRNPKEDQVLKELIGLAKSGHCRVTIKPEHRDRKTYDKLVKKSKIQSDGLDTFWVDYTI